MASAYSVPCYAAAVSPSAWSHRFDLIAPPANRSATKSACRESRNEDSDDDDEDLLAVSQPLIISAPYALRLVTTTRYDLTCLNVQQRNKHSVTQTSLPLMTSLPFSVQDVDFALPTYAK
ncbi:hypothetical protein F5141DRAFT_1067282 [Pisolithus sp. B1]|nr:hypothetical protein F5141DRAFT_1067282 [Pisolithus sp. B1]